MLEQILKNLPEEDRALLMLAFNEEFAQHILLADRKYIGVNVVGDCFKEEIQEGVWSYGDYE